MTKHTVGIDISKDRLDAYRAPDGSTERFSNDSAGFEELINWIGSGLDCVAYEPTGPWHREFEEALQEAEVPLKRINPYQVRCFAKGLGRRAKTDAIDAQVLARMAETVDDLPLTPATTQAQRDLVEFQSARDALIGDRTAILNRGKHLRHPVLKNQNKNRLRQIERQLKRIDAEIKKLLGSRSLARKAEILDSIPGLSDVTAAGLLAYMPELGQLTRSTAASLAGLAPVTRESGNWQGRSFIQGGRHRVRRMLYMPALAGIRFNPDMKRTYRNLKDNGKPSKVALTAVMRKLIVLANALLQRDELWEHREPHPVA